jgi:succinoglycan biosynthesis transport protein ExoP
VQELSPYFIRRDVDPGPANSFPPSPAEEPGLREHWVVIRKHLGLVGVLCLGAVGLTGLVVFNLTRVYTAQSVLLIEPQTPAVLDTKEPVNSAATLPDLDYYKTQYDILRSRGLAAKVIKELDLADQPPFAENAAPKGLIDGWFAGLKDWSNELLAAAAVRPGEASEVLGVQSSVIDEYLKRLEIEPRFGTQLVAVAFTTPDPELSARIANSHVDAYIRRGMELKADAAKNAEEFLSGKLAELKDRVEKSEASLNAYRREHGVITFSLNESGKGEMLEQRLTDLNNTLAKVEVSRIALEVQQELIRKGEADALPAVMQNQLIQNLKQRVAELAAQYADMSNQFNPGYQPLDSLRAKLNQSRTQLAQEINRAAREVESDYSSAAARQHMLEQEIATVKSQALALNDASLQDAVLVRQVDASRNLYKSVLERVRELDVSADAPASNVSVVDRAEAPRSPSSPKKLLSLELSALLGLLGGIGLAFFREFVDDRLKSSEQIERELRLPSLALVPDFEKLSHTGYGYGYGRRTLERKTKAPEEITAENHSDAAIIVQPEGRSAAAEVYHSIRTALLFSQAGQTPRSILFTSAVEDEGKTVTALNVALAFAQTGSRVLLVDADLRKGRCHDILGIENHSGLSEVLTGQKQHEEVIHQTGTGLFFLSAGGNCPNPAALLASSAMRDLLARVSQDYDHVLVDSPPLMPVSDATALAVLVDGVLMIVGASTSKRIVRQACARLGHVGARIFGVALNRVDTANHDYYYYNPYKSYYYRRDSAS